MFMAYASSIFENNLQLISEMISFSTSFFYFFRFLPAPTLKRFNSNITYPSVYLESSMEVLEHLEQALRINILTLIVCV